MTNANAAVLPYEQWEEASQGGAFEDALTALREVVGHLETGHLRLDDSVRCFELGTLLARKCETMLNEAELRISRLDAAGDRDVIEETDEE